MPKENGLADKKETPIQNGLPLFFRQPALVNSERHGKAAVRTQAGFSFCRDTNSIPLNTVEFIEASKNLPIVFIPGDQITPVAIVGLEKSNYLVNDKGEWQKGEYIPAYVRQYPFIFFEKPEDKQFYLCIDEGAPHFNANPVKDALPLYKDSKPSEITQHALQFCTAFYQHHQITKNFCADLQKHELLTSCKSDIVLASGKKLSLGGFLMLDEKRLGEMKDKTFLEFRKKGWLPFIYLALASASNWKHLVDLAEKQ